MQQSGGFVCGDCVARKAWDRLLKGHIFYYSSLLLIKSASNYEAGRQNKGRLWNLGRREGNQLGVHPREGIYACLTKAVCSIKTRGGRGAAGEEAGRHCWWWQVGFGGRRGWLGASIQR